MSATTTATTLEPTAHQRQLIADLSLELGREINVPSTRKAASTVIAKAIAEAKAAQGDRPAPTAKQIRLLERLGAERGRDYKIPATRKQATARIAQVLQANRTQTPAAA